MLIVVVDAFINHGGMKLSETKLSFWVSAPDHDGDAGGGGCNESGGGQPPEVVS